MENTDPDIRAIDDGGGDGADAAVLVADGRNQAAGNIDEDAAGSCAAWVHVAAHQTIVRVIAGGRMADEQPIGINDRDSVEHRIVRDGGIWLCEGALSWVSDIVLGLPWHDDGAAAGNSRTAFSDGATVWFDQHVPWAGVPNARVCIRYFHDEAIHPVDSVGTDRSGSNRRGGGILFVLADYFSSDQASGSGFGNSYFHVKLE